MSKECQPILLGSELLNLVNRAPNAVIIMDADREVYVAANEKALELLQINLEELLEANALKLSPPRMFGRCTRELAEEKLREVVMGGNPVFDWIHLTPKGEQIHTEVRVFRCPPYDRNMLWLTIIDKREREKTLRGLRQSDERLFLALEVTGMGSYDWYPKENALYWDLHMHKLFGSDPDSQQDHMQYFLRVLHPEDRALVVQKMSQALSTTYLDNSFDYDYRILRNGELRYIASRGKVMRNDLQEVVRIVGICRDVTHERKREVLLMDTGQRLQESQEMAKLGSYEISYGNNKVWWSRELYRLLEIDPGIPKPNMGYFIDKVHPDDRELVIHTFSNHIANPSIREIEFRFKSVDGEYKHIRELVFPIRNPQNTENIGIRGICQDITEIKKIQAEAEILEARWNSVAESTFDWLVIIDRKGVVQYLNRVRAGLKKEELIGKITIYDYLECSEQLEVEEKIKLVFEEQAVQYIELYSPPIDSWVANYVAPIIQNGVVVQASIMSRSLKSQIESEKKLKLAQKSMQDAQRIAQIGSWDWNIQNNEAYWSDQLFRIYGLAPQEKTPSPESYLGRVHPDDRSKVIKAFKQVKKGVKAYSVEYRFFRYDNDTMVYLKAEGEVVKDRLGNPERLVGSVQDITQRKVDEKKLEDTLRQLQLSIETAELGVWRFDLKAKQEIWNQQLRKIYGVEDSHIDINKIDWKTYVHPDDLVYVEKQLGRALQGEKLQDVHYRIINAKGELRYLQAYVSPVYNETGELAELIDISVDITKLKKSELALKARENFLQAILENSLYGIVITDDVGNYQFANQAASDILGYGRDEILKMNVGQIQTQSKPSAASMFQEYRRKGQGVGELLFYRPDGEKRVLTYQAFQVEDSMHVSMLADITEQKRAEEELRNSEEKFSKTFQFNPTIMTLVDLETNTILDINEAYRQSTGYLDEEVINIPGRLDYLSDEGEGKKCIKEGIHRVLHDKFLKNFELKIRAKDGRQINGLLFMQPVELKGKELYVCSLVDITERLMAEKKLKESEEKFSKAFMEHPVAMQILDIKSGIRMEVNQALCELTGYAREELVGSSIHKLDLWADSDSKYASIDEIKRKKTIKNLPISILTKTGATRELLGTACMLNIGDDNLIISSYLDVTEQLQAENQLNEAFDKINQLKNQLQAENIYLREEIKLQNNFEDMVFSSALFRQVLNQVEQVAPLDATVLISGETGTGKELIARAIHNLSPRKDRPMIKVNCGALPVHLIESELFGFEKGAFTGASHTKVGRFELADQGTLFLDEIGEMPLEVQVKLLRVLQEGEFERLGSTKTTKVNVRIIAATNRDLKKASQENKFRQDLYFRLSVFPIQVPPLRDRIEDVSILVEHFVHKYANKHGKSIQYIADEAMDYLHEYNWPGNIRELENLIERAVILSPGSSLHLPDINPGNKKQLIRSTDLSLDSVQRTHILKILRNCHWKIDGTDGAAQILGLKPSTLRDRMKKLGVKRPKA